MGGCNTDVNTRLGAEEAANVPPGGVPLQLSLKAYPNPVQDEVILEVLAPQSGPATFHVLDLAGRARQSRSESLTEGRNEVEFRLGKLPSGMYLIRVLDGQSNQAAVRVSKE